MPTQAETTEFASQALENTNGDFTEAAKLLGVRKRELYRIVSENPTLQARWYRNGEKPVSEAVVPRREKLPDAPPEMPLRTELEVAAAIEAEQKALRGGLEKLLDGPSVDIAMECQKIGGRHIRSLVDAMSGLIVRQAFRIQTMVDAIDQRLSFGEHEVMGEIVKMSLQEEAMLRQDRQFLLEVLGRYKKETDGGLLTQARVHAILNAGKKQRSEKPKGFLDLAR